ncbi:MAG: TetR family transcriptional regulator [Acidobacteria bacterium]|nr:TetR family transcriptional regulator [Acidobacteriota bacterium]
MTETNTATALLDAAEVEFAKRGIPDASLRSIMRAADANPAAVHYHYGSREALAREVLERVLRPLNDRRLELLDELEPRIAAGDVTIAELLEALVRPDLEAVIALRKRNPAATNLAGAIYAWPSLFVKALVEEHFAPVARRFLPAMVTAAPGINPSELSWRVRWCVFGVLGALLSDDEFTVDPGDLDAKLNQIVTAASGALTAPQPGRSN